MPISSLNVSRPSCLIARRQLLEYVPPLTLYIGLYNVRTQIVSKKSITQLYGLDLSVSSDQVVSLENQIAYHHVCEH